MCRVCSKNQIWIDAPTCACGCIRNVLYTTTAYYDSNTCTCKCIPQICEPNMIWNPQTCKCVSKISIISNINTNSVINCGYDSSHCISNGLWNQIYCGCEF